MDRERVPCPLSTPFRRVSATPRAGCHRRRGTSLSRSSCAAVETESIDRGATRNAQLASGPGLLRYSGAVPSLTVAQVGTSGPKAWKVGPFSACSESLRRPTTHLRRVLSTRLDVPLVPPAVLPLALPRWRQPAVVRLKLAGLHHAEAPPRLRAECGDEVAGLGHGHGSRVDLG